MNKGLILKYCEQCKRKRFCSCISIPNHNFKYTCSKKHSWIIQGITFKNVDRHLKNIIVPKIKNLSEQDSTFFKQLKGKNQ